jgi:signal transduction histidine kinase
MMTDLFKQTESLQPKELEAIYSISRLVTESQDVEITLDEVVRVLRPVFIFDNIVLYTQNSEGGLEPVYARAIGRGRIREADLAWGERTAQNTYQLRKTNLRIEELQNMEVDRTNSRFTLGLPCIQMDQILGALVFIRFGGPDYMSDQILLAEFVALHAAQLLHDQRLRERIAALEAKRRLDSLQDDFIATITHELLTPLGFIKGYATTLLREDINWDQQTRQEFLTIIDEEADRLRELIDNLMDSSRLQSGSLSMSFQPLRLDTLLKDISMRARTRQANLNIELKIETPGLLISGDPTRLAQVFDNIINNAIKYAPGSDLTITLEKYADQARILIKDSGPGIPKDQLEKIFQRFYRVPSQNTSIRGTGLGLFICRQIIQAHHGEIDADSREGQGATFFIYLPLEVKDAANT